MGSYCSSCCCDTICLAHLLFLLALFAHNVVELVCVNLDGSKEIVELAFEFLQLGFLLGMLRLALPRLEVSFKPF